MVDGYHTNPSAFLSIWNLFYSKKGIIDEYVNRYKIHTESQKHHKKQSHITLRLGASDGKVK